MINNTIYCVRLQVEHEAPVSASLHSSVAAGGATVQLYSSGF